MTYRAILPSETQNSAPVTTTLMTALALNPTAIAEGDNGAPRNVQKSFERLFAGAQIRSRFDGASFTAPDNGFYTLYSYSFAQIGTIRCTINLISGDQTRVIRRRNGTEPVVSGPTTGNTSVDISVQPGDTILLQARQPNGGGGTVSADCRFGTTGGSLWPGAEARLEGNDVVI